MTKNEKQHLRIKKKVSKKKTKNNKVSKTQKKNNKNNIYNQLSFTQKILTKSEFKKLEYPYRHLQVSENKMLDDFNKLKDFQYKTVKIRVNRSYKNKRIVFLEDYDKYKELYKITDYFSHPCRVKCVFNIVEKKSVLDLFQKNKVKIENSLVKKNLDFTYENIEEEIYQYFKQCTNFNTTIAISILKIFKPSKWLDFSAGWGDRLVSAIAYGCDYTGVDPSECMGPIYHKIINTLNPKQKNKYQIIHDGFENAKIKENEYDLVFTSPPFFDFEIYETKEKQSTSKFKNVQSWRDYFLFPAITKSIMSLKKKGNLVLYITDFNNNKYIGDMFYFIKKNFKNVSYEGNLYWVNKSNFRKKRCVYVWKKH